ncbi:YbaB/EbfC family nucleoid-associated protein [Nocardia uniformis]|uniref:YbaB/EbfC family nucleoid-associated protein n=1 Tax=Nocardia uniformis TaxID=53432 RepID=A0A849CB66_9NOCA|nr:YbaB/EbfC family nucleoid-associated protein [Nocardia uniformis]NNH73207.1 YbaB/EbfC family nucleoid-associated protein [Nocardia uniformis]
MESLGREDLSSADDGVREQIDQVAAALGEQQTRLAEVHQQLDAVRCTAGSADGLVQVTVDATGVLTEVRFGAGARRTSLDQLGTAVAAASREASQRARARTWELMASFSQTAGLVPGPPSFGSALQNTSLAE